VKSLWREHRDVEGKRRKSKKKWGRGEGERGGVCTSGIEGKERRKKRNKGERRVLYEREKKYSAKKKREKKKGEMDEGGGGATWVKEMEGG
jgi:hypothetical protein